MSDIDVRPSNGRTQISGAIGRARKQFGELLGMAPASVSAVERTDGGWTIELEVIELERVPSSTSVMATYQVTADSRGDVQGYRRLRRYYRNQADTT